MSEKNASLTDLPATYSGRIMNGNCTDLLRNTVCQHIADSSNFDRIGLNAITYIAAWQLGKQGIWYEFVGQRFLDLFDCRDAERLRTIFCRSILDRREYEYENICPDITEIKLKGQELETQRPRLRNESTQTGVMQAVYKVGLPDGRIVWLKDWATVSTFPDDGICLSPGYMTDISMEMEQKDQVSALNVLVNRDKGLLVEAERFAALGQISAKVFHEIRNPVSAIGGLAKRLLKKNETGQAVPFLEVIVRESERLEEILNNLFSFTKPVTLHLVQSDPVILVKRVIGLLRSDLDKGAIKVSLIVKEDIPFVTIDRDQIHLALVHIIKNSMEAMFEGGVLSIELCLENSKLLIMVRDSGVGIRPIHENRVTEPFFTTKVYGTGLGLSIAQKAIQLHNGSLHINRLESGGTENIIHLPLDV